MLHGMATAIKDRRTADIGAVDFSLAIKLFQEHHFAKMYAFEPCETTGVMVLCPRVAAAHGASPFGEVYVPLQHPAFQSQSGGDESKISKLIGMPLVKFEHPTEEEADHANQDGDRGDGDGDGDGGVKASVDSDERETSPAVFLHLNLRANADFVTDTTSGTIPQEWHERKGSVLVVRQDLKPISASIVEALCKYSAQEAKSLLLKAAETADSRRKLVANISKKNWEEFFGEQ